MRKELLDAGQALGDPAVKLADPDMADAAQLDMAGALPVGGKAHERADHALLAESLRKDRRIHAVLQRHHHCVGAGERHNRVERGFRVLRLHGEKNETQRTFQALGKNRPGTDLERLRAADAQSGRIHCVDVLDRLVDEEHVLACVRHEGADGAADRA